MSLAALRFGAWVGAGVAGAGRAATSLRRALPKGAASAAWGGRLCTPTQLVQRRSFGVGDTIMSMATNKLSENKEVKFAEMLEKMVATPKWTFRPWRDTMQSQLSSWTMYLPGVGSSTEAQELKGFKSMLDAMTDAELDSPEGINGPARERIARAASKSVDDVVRMIFFYKQSLVLFTWLQMKKQKGEPLPTTETEMQQMQESDLRMRQIAAKIMAPKGKTGRGRRLPF